MTVQSQTEVLELYFIPACVRDLNQIDGLCNESDWNTWIQHLNSCAPSTIVPMVYSWVQKFTPPPESAKCYFTKKRGIIQNACYWLFSTDLNTIFHIKYVTYTYKRWISKSYSHCWKRFKYTKMLENQIISVSWRIHSRQFNCSGTHEQLSLN